MLETCRLDFLQEILEECIMNLNTQFPFFIPSDLLREAMDAKITSLMKNEALPSLRIVTDDRESKINSAYNKKGFIIEPFTYSLNSDNKTSIHMNDAQWANVIGMLIDYGFTQMYWHRMLIYKVPSSEVKGSYAFLRFSFDFQDLCNKILTSRGYISFYGGKVSPKGQEQRSTFNHDKFSLSSNQNQHVDFDRTISVGISQLEFLADSLEKQIKRKLYSDAISTIEVLQIS